MSAADQIFTLAGVSLGVTASYLVTALGERGRRRNDQGRRWSEARLSTYAQYISDVKHMSHTARRVAAAKGLTDWAEPLAEGEGLDLLASAEARRGLSSEQVMLLGSSESILAARNLNAAVWRLDWLARGMITHATPREWQEGLSQYIQAVNEFHLAVREELGVPGNYVERGTSGSPRPDAQDQSLRQDERSDGATRNPGETADS